MQATEDAVTEHLSPACPPGLPSHEETGPALEDSQQGRGTRQLPEAGTGSPLCRGWSSAWHRGGTHAGTHRSFMSSEGSGSPEEGHLTRLEGTPGGPPESATPAPSVREGWEPAGRGGHREVCAEPRAVTGPGGERDSPGCKTPVKAGGAGSGVGGPGVGKGPERTARGPG